MSKKIATEYASNNILDLSVKYDIPPLMLLRSILIELGYSSTVLYHVYTRGTPAEKFLHDRDLKQFYSALENDISDVKSQQQVGIFAQTAEDDFVHKLKQTKIGIKTQDDLTKEQMEEFGRAIMTPDILFTDIVYINGTRVNWIDFKSYTLLPQTFIFSSLIKQSTKYNLEFGNGAFVFLYGAPNVSIPKTIILTTDALYAGISHE
jgi:hypothetical protein